ncbi:hypothetical protein CVT24_006550 [Panaeolus cyanescens]|uniref:BED-type domain-containing protein n=1 Tax=Panaeolus cyanescens TaxID=181874 RepID=A0A409YXB5_9AGAR|nr:hypothetical protein CVT24_006550 [Panaeolus cyanescens]
MSSETNATAQPEREAKFRIIFGRNVSLLDTGVATLPMSVREATPSDEISSVFLQNPVPDNIEEKWEVFNKRMDALYGEDRRNDDGALPNILRGKHGLELVVQYLKECFELTRTQFQWEAATNKVVRIVKEVQKLNSKLRLQNNVVKTPGDKKKRKKMSKKAKNSSSSEADDDYHPPKRKRQGSEGSGTDGEMPEMVLDSEGNEIIEDTEALEELTQKQQVKKSVAAAVPKESASAKNKKKKKTKTKKKVLVPPTELSSGEESDGNTALQAHRKASDNAKRGPENASMPHYHTPIPVDDNGAMKWEFKCRYCGKTRRFRRTLDGLNINFDQEKPRPPLQNLATHLNECSKKKEAERNGVSQADLEGTGIGDGFNHAASAKMMEEFLKQGALNPAVEPTLDGFHKIFAAWILDESLPWTTGEAPTLRALFSYLKIRFPPPSDTTVRNQLDKIYHDLHGKIVEELAAVTSKIAYSTDTWTNPQMVYSFAGTTAAYINDMWKLIERVVDFRPLESKEHDFKVALLG